MNSINFNDIMGLDLNLDSLIHAHKRNKEIDITHCNLSEALIHDYSLDTNIFIYDPQKKIFLSYAALQALSYSDIFEADLSFENYFILTIKFL